MADSRGLIQNCFHAIKEEKGSKSQLAFGFHMAVADMVIDCLNRIRKETGEQTVLLSGGVFANRILLETCIERLQQENFQVYWNEQIPGNDGGLAVGQAYLAKLRYGQEENLCV